MSRNVVIAGVVILVLVVGGWFFTRPKQTVTPEVSQSTQESSSSESATSAASSGAQMVEKNIVSINVGGFSPKTITIKTGESITWTNNDSENHTVNSDPHPTHTLYSFLNAGLIKPGDKKTVMFERAGKYTYHDHLNPSLTGSVTVE